MLKNPPCYPVPLEVVHGHVITLSPQTLDHKPSLSFSIFFSSHHVGTIHVLICSKGLVPEVGEKKF